MSFNELQIEMKRVRGSEELKTFNSLPNKMGLVCTFLENNELEWIKLIKVYLRSRMFFLTLATFLEQKYAHNRCPSLYIFEAAETYERAGKLEKALELYQRGVEEFDPHKMSTYDESTGGEVSIMIYSKINQDIIKEADENRRRCQEKVGYMKRKIATRKGFVSKSKEASSVSKKGRCNLIKCWFKSIFS